MKLYFALCLLCVNAQEKGIIDDIGDGIKVVIKGIGDGIEEVAEVLDPTPNREDYYWMVCIGIFPHLCPLLLIPSMDTNDKDDVDDFDPESSYLKDSCWSFCHSTPVTCLGCIVLPLTATSEKASSGVNHPRWKAYMDVDPSLSEQERELAFNDVIDVLLLPPDDEPPMGPTAMEESDSASRASLGSDDAPPAMNDKAVNIDSKPTPGDIACLVCAGLVGIAVDICERGCGRVAAPGKSSAFEMGTASRASLGSDDAPPATDDTPGSILVAVVKDADLFDVLSGDGLEGSDVTVTKIHCPDGYTCHCQGPGCPRRLLLPPGPDDEPMGPTTMEESDSAGRASLAVAAAAAIAYVL